MMTKTKTAFIGVDVGGTKILLETFDAGLRCLSSAEVRTDTRRGEKGFLDELYGLIAGVMGPSVTGIGVALPGIVDIRRGVLEKAPHLPTRRSLPIKAMLEKKFGVRVRLEHDINAFLMAQHERPTLKKYRHLVGVMAGTGVGAAIMIDGKIYRGSQGFAGEAGHMVIRSGAQETLEQCVGGIYAGKELGDRAVKAMVEHFGIGLSNLNLILNPEAIVLGGSVYLHCLAGRKKELKTIIAKHALDQKSPPLIDADPCFTVARGAVSPLQESL